MNKATPFIGAGVALVTPFHPDGSVNHEKYRELIDFQINNGTDAIVAVGTTGEASTLNYEDHAKLLETAITHTAGRVPVIAGTGSNDTTHCIRLSKDAKAMGADGLLLVTPYYNRTSQQGLIKHYSTIADVVDMPMILYNVPSRTSVNIQPETAAYLYNTVPQIVALKQANPALSETVKLASLCDITIYSGNDDLIIPMMALGGKGVISVLSNVAPRQTHDLCAAWLQGEHEKALQYQLDLLTLANALFMDVNPIPVKEALNQMGFDVGSCRLPLCDMTDDSKQKLTTVLQQYALL